MFSSIYKLYWPLPNLVYIGRSKNINDRIRKHTKALESGTHYNSELQKAYNTYGIFTVVEILAVVKEEEANKIELEYIKKYNSKLNLIGTAPSIPINVALSNKNEPLDEIYTESKYTLVGPDNTIHFIDKMINFVRSNEALKMYDIEASRALMKVCRGVRGSYHGFRKFNGVNTLIVKNTHKYTYTISKGEEVHTTTNLVSFCKTHAIFSINWYSSADRLRAVARGAAKTHKGYTCTRQVYP